MGSNIFYHLEVQGDKTLVVRDDDNEPTVDEKYINEWRYAGSLAIDHAYRGGTLFFSDEFEYRFLVVDGVIDLYKRQRLGESRSSE